MDVPGATAPRFPASTEKRVAAAIEAHLRRWEIGQGDLIVSQGARGADIMIAEAGLRLGADLQVLLAASVDDFIGSSVDVPAGQDPEGRTFGSDWVRRFKAVLENAKVSVQPEALGPAAEAENIYTRNNTWALDRASAEASGSALYVLVVDSGRDTKEGGSADFAKQAAARGLTVHVVDPTRALRYEGASYVARQDPDDGPKRLLSLDGGGMRGLISLQVLRRMEEVIGNQDESFRLSDAFDYVAGTSTGAIIAAALATGHTVDEIEAMYRSLGPDIFKKKWLPGRFRSLYKASGVTKALQDFFEPDTTLGDSRLRSLLAVVTHRSDTDSLWPLTNVTSARYNDPNRADCNLNFPLWQIIRGSTAAPVFFPPEPIDLGPNGRALFEDGGVTPFNNPALLLFELATSPRYTLDWPTGPEEIIVVSLGTGSSMTPSSTNLKKLDLLFHARTLIRVMMNGSSTENDRLCQVLGSTRYAPTIDSEFNAVAVNDLQSPHPLFSYVRYNVPIGERDLAGVDELHDISAKHVARLDAASPADMDALTRIGIYAANQVDLAHFAGFLP
jgi:hypothetical protein